ncbi:MAG TPA: hypothetical protein PKC24_15565 [Cyclobacteriaceae bacterium]|nr:hypothetical protein [Cyclobacteriaceae bacterium]
MKKILMVSSLLIAFSCGEKKQSNPEKTLEETQAETRDQLYQDVMDVHDEVMPRMGEINRLKRELEEKLSGLLAGDQSQNAALIEKISQKIKDLEAAGNGMMVWMRQFDVLPDSLGHAKVMEGLEAEMVKIKKVKDDMLNAISNAKEE